MVAIKKAALQGGNRDGTIWCHAAASRRLTASRSRITAIGARRLVESLGVCPVNAACVLSCRPWNSLLDSALRFGWETFKRRPWLFIVAILLIVNCAERGRGVRRVRATALFTGSGEDFAIAVAVSLASISRSALLISMGVTAFLLAAHDNPDTVELSALWHPHPFWKYLGLSIIFSLVTRGRLRARLRSRDRARSRDRTRDRHPASPGARCDLLADVHVLGFPRGRPRARPDRGNEGELSHDVRVQVEPPWAPLAAVPHQSARPSRSHCRHFSYRRQSPCLPLRMPIASCPAVPERSRPMRRWRLDATARRQSLQHEAVKGTRSRYSAGTSGRSAFAASAALRGLR